MSVFETKQTTVRGTKCIFTLIAIITAAVTHLGPEYLGPGIFAQIFRPQTHLGPEHLGPQRIGPRPI